MGRRRSSKVTEDLLIEALDRQTNALIHGESAAPLSYDVQNQDIQQLFMLARELSHALEPVQPSVMFRTDLKAALMTQHADLASKRIKKKSTLRTVAFVAIGAQIIASIFIALFIARRRRATAAA
jgi:hypothetical protein